jgi:hypothetical protein
MPDACPFGALLRLFDLGLDRRNVVLFILLAVSFWPKTNSFATSLIYYLKKNRTCIQ